MTAINSSFASTQKWTLLSTILASSLVFIDSAALNVALPALQKDLGITGNQTTMGDQWLRPPLGLVAGWRLIN